MTRSGTPIGGSATQFVVTHSAVHILPDGADTDAEAVRTVDLSAVEDAQVAGVVRPTLSVTTDTAVYEIRPDGRPSLSPLATFLRRASWSWRRVEPRLASAREALSTLETEFETVEDPEQVVERGSIALSKARSSTDRLEVAVDAIDAEIDRLARSLARQRARHHATRAEATHEDADAMWSAGRVGDALDRYRTAVDHYREALSVVFEYDFDGADRIRTRLEDAREAMYDAEASPVVAAAAAIERARTADDPETACAAWEQVRDRYLEADSAADCPVPSAWIDYQLAWVEANYCRACRAYAADLEAQADDYVAGGDGQWGQELYAAALDQLSSALSVATDSPVVETALVAAEHDRLAAKRDQKWGSIRFATATE